MDSLYLYLSFSEFYAAMSSADGCFQINLRDYLSETKEPYGLTLLRKSWIDYEQAHRIPSELSKAGIPFYRNHQQRFPGPDVTPFVLSFFGEDLWQKSEDNGVVLTFDYAKLADFALTENLFILRCNYDETENLKALSGQLEREYKKVFFDAENIGFTADSHFFSLLCNAAIGMDRPEKCSQKEWRLMALAGAEDACYACEGDRLYAYFPVHLPFKALRRIRICPDYRKSRSYTVLIGFLRKQGLHPERILEGLIEDE